MFDRKQDKTKPKSPDSLHEIGKRLTAIPELDQVLQIATKEAVALAQAEMGVLLLLNRRNDELYLGYQTGLQNPNLHALPVVKDYLVGKVIKTGKPLRLPAGDRRFPLWTGEAVISALYTPMRIRGEVIGVLLVANHTAERSFSEIDEHNLLDLTDYAAIAIQNARLTQAMREISNVIGSALDLKEATGKILDELGKIVGYRKASIQVIPGESRERQLIISRSGQDDKNDMDRWLLRPVDEDLIVSGIIKTRKPLIIPNTEDYDGWEVLPATADVKSWIGLPLISGEQVIGLLTLDHDQAGYYTDAFTDVLMLFGGQAALAIEKASLFRDSQRRIRDLELLGNISNQIIQAQEVGKTLEMIVSGAMELVKPSNSVIHLVDQEKLRVIRTYGFPNPYHPEPRMGNPSGITRTVMATGELIVIPDLEKDARISPKLCEHFRSMIAIPLTLKGNVIGVLFLDTPKLHDFTEAEKSLLSTLAAQAAIAIDNARLLEAEREQRALTEALINSSPVAIVAVDPEGRITRFNEASERIMKYQQKEVLGQPFQNLIYAGANELERINQALENGEKQGKPVRDLRTDLRGKKGESIPVRFTGTSVHRDSGERIASLGLITDLREIEVQDHEYKAQQEFLARLEHYPQITPINSLDDLRTRLTALLHMARQFCNLQYIILFASINENETVLPAVAWEGVPGDIENMLPHFNWKKAGLLQQGVTAENLPQEAELMAGWWPDEKWKNRIVAGIRGENAPFFKNLACGVPVRLADNYRAVVVFSALGGIPDLTRQAELIRSIGQSIGINALSWLQTLYLRAQHKESQNTARLIVHRARTYLTGIMGRLGRIKKHAALESIPWREANEGERQIKLLSDIIVRALISHTDEMEREDLDFQQRSLSALVQNCVDSIIGRAETEKRELRIDSGVERLPYAEIDPVILPIALSNLLENALKYSYEKTYILISAEHDQEQARITIQDYGEQLPEAARQNLLEPGWRWVMTPRARGIPGTGYGLWEASRIVAAHGGKLDFSSVAQGSSGYLVQIWIILPLKQKDAK